MTTTSMALLAWLAGTVGDAGQPQPKVTVYLLDRANERYMACIPAQALAGRMFAAIGVFLEWGKGKPSGESSPPIIIEVVTGRRRISRQSVLATGLLEKPNCCIGARSGSANESAGLMTEKWPQSCRTWVLHQSGRKAGGKEAGIASAHDSSHHPGDSGRLSVDVSELLSPKRQAR